MKSIDELRKEWIAEYKRRANKAWLNYLKIKKGLSKTVNIPLNKLAND